MQKIMIQLCVLYLLISVVACQNDTTSSSNDTAVAGSNSTANSTSNTTTEEEVAVVVDPAYLGDCESVDDPFGGRSIPVRMNDDLYGYKQGTKVTIHTANLKTDN